MTQAFTWINDIVQWLGRWVPKLVLVPPTHCGVRFGPRGGAKACGPGLVVYWPITHVLVQMPVTTQSMQICGQILPLPRTEGILPDCAVAVAAIQFRVTDPVMAATKCLKPQAIVDNRGTAAIARAWPGKLTTDGAWIERARAELADDLAPFGLGLERLDMTQLGIGVALKQLNDWAYSDDVSVR